jgi:hypothetical protein
MPTGADRQLMVPTCADRDRRGRRLRGAVPPVPRGFVGTKFAVQGYSKVKAKSIQLSASCQRIQEKSQKEGSPTEDAGRLICQASKGPQDGSICLQEYRKNIPGSLQTLNGSIFSWQKSSIRSKWLFAKYNCLSCKELQSFYTSLQKCRTTAFLQSFCRSAERLFLVNAPKVPQKVTGSPPLPTISNQWRVVKLRLEAQTLRIRADSHMLPTWQAPINRIRSSTSDLHVSFCKPGGPLQPDSCNSKNL